MENSRLDEYLNFATETTYMAGRLTLAYYQTGVDVMLKPDATPVTEADKRAEELIRKRIETHFPDHGILGEEFGESLNENASHRWIIDPIDGTKAFTHGVPLYGVLLGLEIEGRIEVGAAYFPALDEMLAAASGLGCWWNGRRARVSPKRALKESIVTTTSPTSFERLGKQETWQRLVNACWFARGWSDAYGYLLVATGRAEIMVDPIVNIWDCGPFPPIFREAGGYFGDWKGVETIYAGEALATSQELLPAVLSVMRTNNH